MSVKSKMTALADEVRTLSGTTDTMGIDDMTNAIHTENTNFESNLTEQNDLISQIATLVAKKATPSGTDTSDADATADDLFDGKTAYVNGEKLTGTFTIDNELNEQNDLILQITELVATKASPQGGTDTSDADATADEIFDGKTAYVDGEKLTGTFTIGDELAEQNDLISRIVTLVNQKANPPGEPTTPPSTIQPLKAFEPCPNTGQVQAKNVVPVIDIAYQSAYTNTSDVLNVNFDYGNSGDTLIICAALRHPTQEPTLPDGWERIAWIAAPADDTYQQYLLVGKHVTTINEAGTTGIFSLAVTSAQRNYVTILNIGNSYVDENCVVAKVASNGSNTEIDLYENTLIVCSSTMAVRVDVTGEPWVILNHIFGYKYLPSYEDGSIAGGRLGIIYVPSVSNQIADKLRVQYTSTATDTSVTCMILCALKLNQGTPARYVCSEMV